jgi:hypothetical protein
MVMTYLYLDQPLLSLHDRRRCALPKLLSVCPMRSKAPNSLESRDAENVKFTLYNNGLDVL